MTFRTRLPSRGEVLSSRPVTGADDAEAAAELAGPVLGGHEAQAAAPTRLAARLRRASAGCVELVSLSYGDTSMRLLLADEARPQLVLMPLEAGASMRSGHAVVAASPGTALVPPTSGRVELRLEAGCTLFGVRIDQDEAGRIAAAAYDLGSPRAIPLAPRLDLESRGGRAFVRAVQELHRDLDGRGSRVTLIRRLGADLVVARLYDAVDHAVARSLDSWTPAKAEEPGGERTVSTRYLAALDRHSELSTTVADIAEELGVPVRTLQTHVRRATQRTPSELLRDVRFRRARELLVEADPTRTTVAAVAQRCGFAHHGRFATEYRDRYGEAPATTLRRID